MRPLWPSSTGCGPTWVYCHIHRPFIRDLGEFVVANTGSVGLPWDGDTRASYLWIEDGKPEIRRVAYNVERHVAELEQSAIRPAAG